MVGRVLPFLAYGWISQVVINNRGNKAFVLIQKQSHLFQMRLFLSFLIKGSGYVRGRRGVNHKGKYTPLIFSILVMNIGSRKG